MSGAMVKANFSKVILPSIKRHFDKVTRGDVVYTEKGKPVKAASKKSGRQ